MRSQRLAIGDNYIDNPDYTWEEENGDGGEIDYLADLVVEGNVGIGTTAPESGYGGIMSADTTLSILGGVSGHEGGTSRLNLGGDNRHYASIVGEHTTGGRSNLQFYTSTGATNPSEKMRIDYNGNVGIGTTGPGYKLHVAGSTYLSNFPTVSSGGTSLSGWGIGNGTWPPQVGAQNPYVFNYHTGLAFSAHSAYGGIRFYNQAYPNVTQSTLVMNIINGNVGIGTTSPSYTLHVNGSVAGTSAYNNLSDKRFKKNVQPISKALSSVMALQGVTFNWDKTANPSLNLDEKSHFGFIAQEVEPVLPQVVTTANDSLKSKSIAYAELVPVLTEAIKEQQGQIDNLKQEISQLKEQSRPAE